MAVEITAILMSPGGTREQHITDYRWTNLPDGSRGENNKAQMVKFLDQDNGVAYVGNGSNRVRVGVVHPQNGAPYLRTYADEQWNNNLLSLPRF